MRHGRTDVINRAQLSQAYHGSAYGQCRTSARERSARRRSKRATDSLSEQQLGVSEEAVLGYLQVQRRGAAADAPCRGKEGRGERAQAHVEAGIGTRAATLSCEGGVARPYAPEPS